MNEIRDAVSLFKRDLWKDQRKLEVLFKQSEEMIKYYDSTEELNTEVSVSAFLNSEGIEGIPSIIQYDSLSTIMPYYKGIRLFNLFVELDTLTEQYNDKVNEIKRKLVQDCENRQIDIQKALIKWSKSQQKREAYPHAKVRSIVDILSTCLGIEIKQDAIDKEIDEINQYWNNVVEVPFRDATSKNMILNSSRLYMGNYLSDIERKEYLNTSIRNGSYYEWLNAPIIDIDFSSCIHDTTFEDDVISLKYHERTWEGQFPNIDEVLWNGTPDAKRAAITFLIRYFRFGGRKAAYRLIHPKAHRIRFKYDNDLFYFKRLSSIMQSLWPQCEDEYPNLMKFIETASRYLITAQVNTDLFLEYDNEQARYYTDVFPN